MTMSCDLSHRPRACAWAAVTSVRSRQPGPRRGALLLVQLSSFSAAQRRGLSPVAPLHHCVATNLPSFFFGLLGGGGFCTHFTEWLLTSPPIPAVPSVFPPLQWWLLLLPPTCTAPPSPPSRLSSWASSSFLARFWTLSLSPCSFLCASVCVAPPSLAFSSSSSCLLSSSSTASFSLASTVLWSFSLLGPCPTAPLLQAAIASLPFLLGSWQGSARSWSRPFHPVLVQPPHRVHIHWRRLCQ